MTTESEVRCENSQTNPCPNKVYRPLTYYIETTPMLTVRLCRRHYRLARMATKVMPR